MGLLTSCRRGLRSSAALALGAALVLPGCRTVVDRQAVEGDARPGVVRTWRGTGRTHGVIAFVRLPLGAPPLTIEAGSVLVPADPTLQRYLVTAPVAADGSGPPGGAPVRGLCLDADRRPWPRDATVVGVAVRSPRDVAGERVDLYVAMRAVSGPVVPGADEVAAQWALWRVSDGKTREDVAAAVERESPALPAEERAAIASSIWEAATLVLEVEEEGPDWAALDLTRK